VRALVGVGWVSVVNRQHLNSLAVIAGLVLCAAVVACGRPKLKPPGLTGMPLPVPPPSVQSSTEKPHEHEPVEGLPIPFVSKRRRALPSDADATEAEPQDGEEVTIE
jgi:hypothetical protein